jgi:hypothetical protein
LGTIVAFLYPDLDPADKNQCRSTTLTTVAIPIYHYLRDFYHLTLLFLVPFINIILVIIVATQVEFSKISIFRRDSGKGAGIVHTVSDRGATEEQLCSCMKLPEKKYGIINFFLFFQF